MQCVSAISVQRDERAVGSYPQLYLKDDIHLLPKPQTPERYLNSLVQISRHPVRTSHVYILKSIIVEIEYSRVLKIISNYGSY